MAFRTILMHPTFVQRREDAKRYLDHASERYVEYTSTPCASIPDLPRVYYLCSAELKPVLQLGEHLAVHRSSPDDVSESQ